jgi:uncharacterized coiled-coil protein SlyX
MVGAGERLTAQEREAINAMFRERERLLQKMIAQVDELIARVRRVEHAADALGSEPQATAAARRQRLHVIEGGRPRWAL